eukprot:TRINITY_DN20200_c0_g1_i2.p1 TRINITY_DN20200_c0_g1~~TRINITY_DN20200_c0_g1_i2.p1  ORF type:complete len:333 (+),score=95.46 TRINITY_DN20200_c0_g1_i2:609-1607(+)
MIRSVVAALERDLDQGGIGIGMGIAYTEKATHEEVYRVFEMAGKRAACLFIHNRGEMMQLSDMHELFADAAATGAPLQICHIASSCGKAVSLSLVLEMIDALNSRGIDVTCEQYPYTAGMTRLDGGVFKPGWQDRLGIGYTDLEWVDKGRRIVDKEDFAAARAAGGLAVVHSVPSEFVDMCFLHPKCMIASDCIPCLDGRGHPRGAGCFCRVLGGMVRERKLISLKTAIRKMTLDPAVRLEPMCAAFRKKGRMQVGCDADICVFDPASVSDKATYERPTLPSVGVAVLLVKGHVVVRDGEVVDGARHGEPLFGACAAVPPQKRPRVEAAPSR